MRACVVVFPGSNADAEMVHTLRDVCGVPTKVVWHTDVALPGGTDLVALPGGFAFGDYLRTGAIAKVKIARMCSSLPRIMLRKAAPAPPGEVLPGTPLR